MDTNTSNVVADGADDFEVTWKVEFPHLSWEDFCLLRRWAEGKQLDVRKNHVAAEVRVENGKPRLVCMVKIDALRAKAHATGTYGGCRVVREVKDERGELVAVEAVARRRIGEEWVEFPQTAYLEMYCPGGVAPSTFWEKGKGRVQQLAKCAMSLALRDAFSELAGQYAPEEMEQQLLRDRRPRRDDDPASPEDGGRTVEDTDLPTTLQQLRPRLMDYGFRDEASQDKLIAGFRSRWRAERDNSQTFYMNVFKAVREDPERYGGTRPAAA